MYRYRDRYGVLAPAGSICESLNLPASPSMAVGTVLLCVSALVGWRAPVRCADARMVRCAQPLARVTNSDSMEAQGFKKQALSRPDKGRPVDPPRKRISYDKPDLASPIATFEALCRMCGVASSRNASLDYQGFLLAFEQLYTGGVPLDPATADELKSAVGISEEEDVTMAKWNDFHRLWLAESSMEAILRAKVERRRAADEAELERRAMREEAEKKEQEWSQALAKAKMDAAQQLQAAKPKLLADEAAHAKKRTGAYFAERESAAIAAAQYRSLAPENWYQVTRGVGGLDAALEQIRRRIWTPLCAPRQVLDELGAERVKGLLLTLTLTLTLTQVLDELGAERVKGLLLYGPPGCGKSYVAARLAEGLSRRAPTVVSGPEIMDKYIGNSEAQLRTLFTSPPPVEARPGDADDVHAVAEANELHVVVLDEFDAIARQRGDGSRSGLKLS